MPGPCMLKDASWLVYGGWATGIKLAGQKQWCKSVGATSMFYLGVCFGLIFREHNIYMPGDLRRIIQYLLSLHWQIIDLFTAGSFV